MAIRYVNTASTPGGDGTTNGTTGATRAYASLNEWEAARQAVLSEIEECICEGATADTTLVNIDGWTTTAAYYIYVHSSTAGKHDGKWNTSKYRLEVTIGNDGSVLGIREQFVVIDGLQISVTYGGTSIYGSGIVLAGLSAGAVITIKNNIIRGVLSSTGTTRGIIGHYLSTLRVVNNIIYDFNVGGSRGISARGTVYAYNNTVHNCINGIVQADETLVAKNNICQNCTNGYDGNFSGASTNNCSDIASDAPGSNPRTGDVVFVDEAGDDLHLASSDTVALDYGTDLSGDANYPFSDDNVGTSRPQGSAWDMGALETIAGGGGVVGQILKGKTMESLTLGRLIG